MWVSDNIKEVIPGHRYHCRTWWGHSCRAHSALTGMVSSSLLSTLHRSDHGSGDDRGTGQSLGHKYLTVTHLENRNILDSRGKNRIRKTHWALWSDSTHICLTMLKVENSHLKDQICALVHAVNTSVRPSKAVKVKWIQTQLKRRTVV